MAGWPATVSVTSLSVNAGGLVLPAPWLKVENLLDLEVPAGFRRSSIVIPGLPGRRRLGVLPDEAVWDLRLIVRGDILHSGATPANARVGRRANVAHLYDQCAANTAGRLLVFTDEAGDDWTGVADLELKATEVSSTWGRYALTVTLAAGTWTAA